MCQLGEQSPFLLAGHLGHLHCLCQSTAHREQPLVDPLSCHGWGGPQDSLGHRQGSQMSGMCSPVRMVPLLAFQTLHLSPLSVSVNCRQGTASGSGLVSRALGEASVWLLWVVAPTPDVFSCENGTPTLCPPDLALASSVCARQLPASSSLWVCPS